MSDWQQLNIKFSPKLLMEEIEGYEWKRYCPEKKDNNRWGLSVTSLDGKLTGIPDLNSLRDYYEETGQVVRNRDINTLTEVYHNSHELKKMLGGLEPWLIRTHFIRMDAGSYFPDHFDMAPMDLKNDQIRLTAFVNVNEYGFKWIYDDKIIKCNNGTVWYFNSHKRHSVHATQDNMMILVICLRYDLKLYEYLMKIMKVK